MKNNETMKLNIKSDNGFTMVDLIVALGVFTVFTSLLCTLLYSVYKNTLQTRMSALATNYAIQILEDIDLISYDVVKDGMEDYYIDKFSIASGFNVSIDVRNYSEKSDNQDVIKLVNLTISYDLGGSTEKIVIKKIKIREIA